jgi:hypothetical protein
MAYMTTAIRLFLRQERLVMHNLEIFLHLQEMDFKDPRVLEQGASDVIDSMVRIISLLWLSELLLTYHRSLSASWMGSIQSNTSSSPRYFPNSENIFARIPQPPSLPTGRISSRSATLSSKPLVIRLSWYVLHFILTHTLISKLLLSVI